MCSPSSPSPPLSSQQLLPTSQPNEGARLARRQRIMPREECCMQKTSPSAAESVSVSVRCKNLGFSQLQGRNYWSHCSFQPIRRRVTSRLVSWKVSVYFAFVSSNCEQFQFQQLTYRTSVFPLSYCTESSIGQRALYKTLLIRILR